MNNILQCFFVFSFSCGFYFQFFPPLKNWQRMFLIYCLAFFNILHSCWRQYCLNLSQYWYQNIKSCCQVSWHSNLLRRTRDKDLSLRLIASLSMWSCQESGPASEGRTCLASSCDGGCSVLMLGSHRSLSWQCVPKAPPHKMGSQLLQIHLSGTDVLSTIWKESPTSW